MEYDNAFNLKRTIKQNNEIIEYTGGNKIGKITSPSGEAQIFSL
jgi:hypothetical protein